MSLLGLNEKPEYQMYLDEIEEAPSARMGRGMKMIILLGVLVVAALVWIGVNVQARENRVRAAEHDRAVQACESLVLDGMEARTLGPVKDYHRGQKQDPDLLTADSGRCGQLIPVDVGT